MSLNWESFLEQACSLSKLNRDNLLDLILTQDEKSMLMTRLLVFRALLDGELTQREISKKLSVSIATITRCSNYLKNMPDSLLQQVKIVVCEEKA